MNHVLDRVVIQMDMYNINIVSDLRTIYHDTNSMIFFTSTEMHISTRALLLEFGSIKKLSTSFTLKQNQIFAGYHKVALDFPHVGIDLFF